MLAIQGAAYLSLLDSLYGRLLLLRMVYCFLNIVQGFFFFGGGVTPNSIYNTRGVGQNSTNSYEGGSKSPIFIRTYFLDVP